MVQMSVCNNGHMKTIGKCQIPLLDMMIRNIIIMILMKMLMKNGSKEEMDGTRYLCKKKKKSVEYQQRILQINARDTCLS